MLSFNFDPFPLIKTERLIMRRISMDDREDFFEIRSNPAVNRFLDRQVMQSLNEATEFMQRIIDGLDTNSNMSWAISMNDNPKLIGTIDFWKISKEHHRAEIGYILHPAFQNKGIMSEAMTAALDYGFRIMKLHSIEANINPANEASKKLVEKFGFEQEAYFKENYYFNGKFLDSVIYSLLTPR